MEDKRATARLLAKQAVEQGRPLAWFEELYRQNRDVGVPIPWADLRVNPNLVQLFEKLSHLQFGRRALKVGCGLGDDAQWLASRGLNVTAFDISPTAIDECRRRYGESSIKFVVADLLEERPPWREAFDLVVESYTLQVLPAALRRAAITKIARYVAPEGYLLVIARGREVSDPPGNMPWPLTHAEIDEFKAEGLTEIYFQDYMDNEAPPVRRFRACYQRVGEKRLRPNGQGGN